MPTIKLFVNGTLKTTFDVDSVKIVVEGEDDDGQKIQIHHNFTQEGVIVDLIDEAEAPEDVIATSSTTYTDLAMKLLEGDG